MNVVVRNILQLIILLSLSVSSTVIANQACGGEEYKEKLLDELKNLSAYSLVGTIDIHDTDVNATSMIYGKPPDKLRINYVVSQGGQKMTQKVVFDGEYQWIESRGPGYLNVQRLTLAKLAEPGRPFDTFYYVNGTGLLSAEDYPGTVRTLISVYEVEMSCLAEQRAVARGFINREKFRAYLKESRYYRQRQGAIDRFVKSYGYIDMRFTNHLLTEYTLGERPEEWSFRVEFTNIRKDSDIKNDVFQYDVPATVDAVDITDEVIRASKEAL